VTNLQLCAIYWRFSSTPRSSDGSAALRFTADDRSRSTSRSPQGHLSSRQQGHLNDGTNDVTVGLTLSSDLMLPRPWLGLPSLPVLRNPGTDQQLLRRYEANPFVSRTTGGLLPQPRFETHPSLVLSAVPRVSPLLGELLTTSRSAELPASTTDDQKLLSSSAVTNTTNSSNMLPGFKLLGPADVQVPAHVDFRSRDGASINGLVVPTDESYRISTV